MATISLFPLNTVLFPEGQLPLQVFELRYLDLVKRCIEQDMEFGVVSLLRGSELQKPGRTVTLAKVGTMARIATASTILPGLMQIDCVGTTRFRILSSEMQTNGLWTAEAEPLADDREVSVPLDQRDVASALNVLLAALEKKPAPPAHIPVAQPYRYNDAGWVANRWCEHLRLDLNVKQRLLALDNPVLRLELVQDLLNVHGLLG